MGSATSRDGEEQEQHPMRLSRLGPRAAGGIGGMGSFGAAGLPTRTLLDSASLRDRFHQQPMLPLHPHDVSVVLHRSPVQRSGIVANVVNLDKSSLAVVPAPDDPRVLLLQFNFSASVDGFLAVYYCARQMVHRGSGTKAPVRRVSYVPLDVPSVEEQEEEENGNNNEKLEIHKEENAGTGTQESTEPISVPVPVEKQKKKRKSTEKTKFSAGNALQYRQKRARGLRLDAYNEALLTDVVEGQYPIVIRIEARHPADSPVPKRARVVSQSTFAILTRASNGDWGIKMVRQEVLVGGTIYVVEELYGIGAVDVTASRQDKKEQYSVDKSNECVICLTEPSNTAVLPCGHLCLCQDCGGKLSTDPSAERRRCPICRTDLESLLHILPTTLSSEKKRADKEKRTHSGDGNIQGNSNSNSGDGIKEVEVELEPLSSGDGDVDGDSQDTAGTGLEIERLTKDANELSISASHDNDNTERREDRAEDGPGSSKEPNTLRVVYKVEDEASLSSEVSGGEEDGNVTPVVSEGSKG